MLTEMRLHVVVNETDKFSKIQSLKNHDLIVINLIFMNNLYFLDIVKNSVLTENLSMQVNAVITNKKSNHKQ